MLESMLMGGLAGFVIFFVAFGIYFGIYCPLRLLLYPTPADYLLDPKFQEIFNARRMEKENGSEKQ